MKMLCWLWSLCWIPLLLNAQNSTLKCLKGNCQDGFGKCTLPNGAVYEGSFKSGKIQGLGTMDFPNRDRYSGEWISQIRQGKGRYKFATGDEYLGEFYANVFQGTGTMTYVDGSKYEGQWYNNQPQGKGLLIQANKDRYEGDFQQGKFGGKGTLVYANGEKYTGEWKDGKPHGNGTLFKTGGNQVSGVWDQGRYLAASRLEILQTEVAIPNDSLQYRNCNVAYCASGLGQFVYRNGTRYVGYFANGNPEGLGKTFYNNGDRYEGGWKNNNPQGRGIMYYRDGRILTAVWEKGLPVQKLFEEQEKPKPTPKPSSNSASDVKIWAVIVGAAQYNHLVSLRFTDDDAYLVYAFLRSPEGGAVPENQIRLLIDEDATRSGILAAMNTLFQKADDNDEIFFYFSGHGIEGSFLPIDYDGYNNNLQHEELKNIIEKSRAKHKIIIADACHAGSIGNPRNPIHLELEKFYRAFVSTKGGTALFMSSKSEEYSLEDNGLRSGVFSHFLIKGLKGPADQDHNNIVTVKEAFDYVQRNVRTYTANVQTPLLLGTFDQAMPFALIRE